MKCAAAVVIGGASLLDMSILAKKQKYSFAEDYRPLRSGCRADVAAQTRCRQLACKLIVGLVSTDSPCEIQADLILPDDPSLSAANSRVPDGPAGNPKQFIAVHCKALVALVLSQDLGTRCAQ